MIETTMLRSGYLLEDVNDFAHRIGWVLRQAMDILPDITNIFFDEMSNQIDIVTQLKHDENIGNVPLDLITKVWSQVAGEYIFTSLKSKTHLGRPKWNEIFNQLVSGENASTANDVNVFFCGPATMAKAIRDHCATYRFRFYEEKF
jgi:hypothetical protein